MQQFVKNLESHISGKKKEFLKFKDEVKVEEKEELQKFLCKTKILRKQKMILELEKQHLGQNGK